MKTFSGKHSKKIDPRQAVREARKAAGRVFAPGEVELLYVREDGTEIHRLNPVTIPGYTYSF